MSWNYSKLTLLLRENNSEINNDFLEWAYMKCLHNRISVSQRLGFPDDSDGKESVSSASRPRFNPWVGKIPWRRKWQPTPVFLPGELHEQRSLVGYSPWHCKELDVTDQLTLSLFFHTTQNAPF